MPTISNSAIPAAVTVLDRLSASQGSQAENLAAACRQADSISLSYPSDEESCRHYLLSGQDGQLLAALAVIPYENCQAECCAFTHPQYRRQGYFSALLERALADWEEYEFTFAVEESCKDTCAVLETLGAELDHRELQMEYRAPAENPSARRPGPDSSSQLWHLTDLSCPDHILGSCQTSPLSPGSVCLHHVEIQTALRGKGLGTALVRLLLAELAANGVTHVLLHVSGDNLPAVALYKKTGFCITKTLSYYLY